MRRRRLRKAIREQCGTASVELVGVLPALLLAVLIAAQLAATGYALWSAAIAARAGARAAIVERDAETAALQALPSALRDGARVRDSGSISVTVPVPTLVPLLPELRVRADTSLPADRETGRRSLRGAVRNG